MVLMVYHSEAVLLKRKGTEIRQSCNVMEQILNDYLCEGILTKTGNARERSKRN